VGFKLEDYVVTSTVHLVLNVTRNEEDLNEKRAGIMNKDAACVVVRR
jgi:hypothetical protein